MSLTIKTREAGDITVLDIAGHSQISDGTILHDTVRALTKQGKRLFVLNLQNTSSIDSFGLGQIVSSFLTVRDNKGQMHIANANPQVRDVLRYSRVDTVLKVVSSEAEAIQDLQRQAS
jgi:anti-sigma B factor antagonist